jgi:hypothetical protein
MVKVKVCCVADPDLREGHANAADEKHKHNANATLQGFQLQHMHLL